MIDPGFTVNPVLELLSTWFAGFLHFLKILDWLG